MKEIIIDNSVDLFIMYPPYLGVDIMRYGHHVGQVNDVNDPYIFAKRLGKIAKNCKKALKDHGNLLYILPANNPELLGLVAKSIKKRTKMQFNGTLIWDYTYDDGSNPEVLNAQWCHILWFSKGNPKVDTDYIKFNNYGIIQIPLEPEALAPKYGQMGLVGDSMPEKLAQHLIRTFSLKGDTVANVMGGTGTVTVGAENSARDSIYNDISFVQLTIAKRRLEDVIAEKKKLNLS